MGDTKDRVRQDRFAQTEPKWPTAMRSRLRDGRLVGVPGAGVWLYKRVPMAAVEDAKDLSARLAASQPLSAAFEAVAAVTPTRGGVRRSMVKQNYRPFHVLMLNVPRWFEPPLDHPVAHQLREDYGQIAVDNRVLLFGVRLRDQLIGKRGLRGAVDSVMETLTTGGTPIEDYDEDFERMDSALTRAGLLTASAADIRLANAWFNYGLNPDPMIMPTVDSAVVFSSPSTARYAWDNLRDVPLERWPDLDGYHELSMAAVQDIELDYTPADRYLAMWGSQLVDAGATAVSIRGLIEPQRITRKEVQSQQKRYIEDINERVANNKLEKHEQQRMLADLEAINALYGTGGAPPTLVDTSIVVGFGRAVNDLERLLPDGTSLHLNPMTNRQPAALVETWPCSNVRANPHLLDLPASVVAFSGLVSLSRVGDLPKNGAAIAGFTENDRQPAWFDPRAAYEADRAPIYLCAGASGSGKLLTLTTPVPTPSGWTTMGQLKVGDEVIGRDGKPCRVTALSEVVEKPDLYRITLSDGQQIEADANHQWVVSSYADRMRPRRAKHLAAQENRRKTLSQVSALHTLARSEGHRMVSVRELHELVSSAGIDRWKDSHAIRASLRMVDVPVAGERSQVSTVHIDSFEQAQPVTLYNVRAYVSAALDNWLSVERAHEERLTVRQSAVEKVRAALPAGEKVTSRGLATLLHQNGAPGEVESLAHAVRACARRASLRGDRTAPKRVEFLGHELLDVFEAHPPARAGHQLPEGTVAAARRVIAQASPAEESYPRDIARRLIEAGARYSSVKTLAGQMSAFAKDAGLQPRTEHRQVVSPARVRTGHFPAEQLYRADEALRGLALRLQQIQADRGLALGVDEQVLSTAEMLAEGVKAKNGGTNFAIRVPKALDLPEADLPVDPYVMGAWLGDGRSSAGAFTADPRSGDQQHLRDQIHRAGLATTDHASSMSFGVPGLTAGLKEAGVLGDKHIPATYLRASAGQRMALLQGLMDTDGSISTSGHCSLDLSDRRLAEGAVELIRSLGIKVTVSWDRPSGYLGSDGDYVQCKPRHRIRFTTHQPVFRLPRKLERVPGKDAVHETAKWLYIESIEPIAPEPGRCITVDSPDSTYLAAQFVPTHNTVFMLHLADQFARAGTPTVIVDPKVDSDHSDAVLNSGGQVISLDQLLSADGVFDPLRFGMSPETSVDLAASMLQEVNPWGDDRAKYEVPVNVALAWGVEKGATCTGQALQIALQDGRAPKEMVEPVIALAQSNAQFRAMCGLSPQSAALRVAEGITYIRVGKANLSLPEPGATNLGLVQRITINLVRLMVSGSAMALTGRDGVVMLDEAWVFLGSGNTELERLARVARSQRVTAMLFTQRVSDATVAGIDEHIAGGFILPLKRAEAKAACEILQIEPTAERIERIVADATIGEVSDGDLQPNWNSMRTLYRAGTREVIRGSVALYADIHDRVVPVEIVIPEAFLVKASTNPQDIARRKALAAQKETTGVPAG